MIQDDIIFKVINIASVNCNFHPTGLKGPSDRSPEGINGCGMEGDVVIAPHSWTFIGFLDWSCYFSISWPYTGRVHPLANSTQQTRMVTHPNVSQA